jgi:hypothetical protein
MQKTIENCDAEAPQRPAVFSRLRAYFAGFEYVAETAGEYKLLITTFESVSTGEMVLGRD